MTGDTATSSREISPKMGQGEVLQAGRCRLIKTTGASPAENSIFCRIHLPSVSTSGVDCAKTVPPFWSLTTIAGEPAVTISVERTAYETAYRRPAFVISSRRHSCHGRERSALADRHELLYPCGRRVNPHPPSNNPTHIVGEVLLQYFRKLRSGRPASIPL